MRIGDRPSLFPLTSARDAARRQEGEPPLQGLRDVQAPIRVAQNVGEVLGRGAPETS